MRIGELAEKSGVTVRTIRYYIEEGLLPPPARRGSYGDFDESYIQRLQLIAELKRQRLSLSAIHDRLAAMGVLEAQHSGPYQPSLFAPSQQPLGPPTLEQEAGLFRSRFGEESGLSTDQVAQLESLGLFESREGLLPRHALPLARAVSTLLSWGATWQDIASLARNLRQEAELQQRLLRQRSTDPLSQALHWQELLRLVDTVRRALLWRWAYLDQEDA
ncbi:MAG: MerR family transcriptional regulator [Chloroflexia bacterium]|nr:MerR family transcriptional regulator [Chloroflexia bacterium]